jgi:hypothetical protein
VAGAEALVAEAIDAHGGLDRWRSRDAVRLRISSGGVAFATKGQGDAVRGLSASVATTGQRVTFDDYPEAGTRGIFEDGAVRIERDGAVLDSRAGGRRKLRWDALDMLAFAGAALWTYISLPFVLADDAYAVDELPGRRLRVTFPRDVVTHCPTQVLHLDDRGLIARHDYTALGFGRWARAAQGCRWHAEIDRGIVTATQRRVHPRLPRGRPFTPLLLVWIELSGDSRHS